MEGAGKQFNNLKPDPLQENDFIYSFMKFHVTLRKPDTVYYTCNDRLSEELVAVCFF